MFIARKRNLTEDETSADVTIGDKCEQFSGSRMSVRCVETLQCQSLDPEFVKITYPHGAKKRAPNEAPKSVKRGKFFLKDVSQEHKTPE